MKRKDITYRLFKWTGETFRDEDIKSINERAIWYRFTWGSGLGGEGQIVIYTRDLKRYLIDGTPLFEGIPRKPGQNGMQHLADVFPVLWSEAEEGEEVNGWTMYKKWHGREYIHKDIKILDDFLAGLDKEDGQIEQILYYKTKESRDEREAYERHFREVRLKPEEIPWRDIDNGGYGDGCYTLLFRKDEKTKEYEGCIFLINYQKEEFKPGSTMWNAEIDSYNLFYRYFHEIEGPLDIYERKKKGSLYEFATATELSPTLMDHILWWRNLDFVRAFKTLEEAKSVVPYWAQIWGRIDRENLILPGTKRDDDKEVLERRLKRAELLLIYAEHHGEILEALKTEITPGNALPEIKERLGLEEYDASMFWHFMEEPQLLCKDSLELAKKQVEEYKELLKKYEENG